MEVHGRGALPAKIGHHKRDATMSYTITRLLTDATFDEIDSRTRKALSANGFGVLTEI